MQRFFNIIKQSLVFCLILFTVTVFSYTDSLFTPPPLTPSVAEAGGGLATEATQWINRMELSSIFGTTNSTAVSNLAQLALDQQENYRNFVLNGIAWTLAKQTLSRMVSGIIDWVNSGFEGRPAFVQDLQGFLVEIMDQVAGDYINYIVGGDSFVCSPFRLDIAAALDLRYRQARAGRTASPQGCTFSDMVGNIEQFLAGNFTQGGGWENWINLTSNPTNTPLGSLLAAEAELNIRLVNAAGQELEIVRWGQGFLSSQICESVSGPGGTQENCFISNPGQVINQQLNEALGSSFATLVEVDEWNELVTALFGQLAQRAVTGINGLLGLSGGTRHSYTSPAGSFLAEMQGEIDQVASGAGSVLSLIDTAIDVTTRIINLANVEIPRIEAAIALGPGGGRQQSGNQVRIDQAQNTLDTSIIPTRITALNQQASLQVIRADVVARQNNPSANPPVGISEEEALRLINNFNPRLLTQGDLDAAQALWPTIMR